MLSSFELVTPKTLDEAIEALAECSGRAAVFAGGTDVLVQIRTGALKLDCLIDLKGIDELKGIKYSAEGGLEIGALATHRELETSALIRERFPIIHDGVSKVGSVQIRNRATVVGNICNALPSADSIGPLMALGAIIHICGPKGRREMPLEQFLIGPRRVALEKGEIVTKIVAPPTDGQGCYIKYTRRKAMDLALLGASVFVACDKDGRVAEARIALTTAAPTVMRASEAEACLKGQILSDEALAKAGEIASREAKPRTSWRGSEEYRRHLLKVLVPRAGKVARDRLQAAGSE
jgi:CO/xanthine dehydrogenase FAD-binding subunit